MIKPYRLSTGTLALYPGLLTHAFNCYLCMVNAASHKCWDEKGLDRRLLVYISISAKPSSIFQIHPQMLNSSSVALHKILYAIAGYCFVDILIRSIPVVSTKFRLPTAAPIVVELSSKVSFTEQVLFTVTQKQNYN